MTVPYIDSFLNKITMYRAMLYFLLILISLVIIFSFFGWVPYDTLDIIQTSLILFAVCLVTNWIFSKIFRVPTNNESAYITAAILTLIITPGADLLFVVLAAVFSQAAKYIINFRGKHIFNPAAIAVIATLLVIQQGASWWVGNIYLVPFVIVGGLLIARKLQHFDLVISFLIVYLIRLVFSLPDGANSWSAIKSTLINSSTLYFAFVMLTEPLTTPPNRKLRITYGAIVGFIAGTNFIIGPLYSSPELALVLGNIFSFLVSDKGRYKMTLKEKKEIAPATFGFEFTPNRKINFQPGQYLEWTLKTKKDDLRGNRRYFTIASSPTEDHIDLGIKFYDKPSTFKQTLTSLNAGETVLAGQLAGDFTLPKDTTKKLVFIAGGIGITPFRSMVKYLIDKKEKRDIVLFYSVKTESEIAYKDILSEAANKLGIKIIYVVTDRDGLLDRKRLEAELPIWSDRTFYVSWPRGMVVAFEKLLKSMGVSKRHIKSDFFPGYV